MKILLIGVGIALLGGGAATAQEHYVNGYTKADGTYVAPHMAANPGSGGSGYAMPSYNSPTFGYTNPSSHPTSGYNTPTGTYVNPYMATNPNGTRTDNYSTKGNMNPYTGQPGTKSPY